MFSEDLDRFHYLLERHTVDTGSDVLRDEHQIVDGDGAGQTARFVHYRQTPYSIVTHSAEGLVSWLVAAARVRSPRHHLGYRTLRRPDIVCTKGQRDIAVSEHPHDAAVALDHGQEPAIMRAHLIDRDPEVRFRTHSGKVR
ncbi:MAG: hypothetical protein OXB98_07085 [Bryobacterales bacterium]|nr:hypothetical protein [Bryobacterales bacterium]